MKVILFKNLDNLGLPGDITEVKAGYYRNFLLPRGLAAEATPANLKSLELKRKKLKAEADKIVSAARDFGDQIKNAVLKFTLKAGENNRLFGSVTSADIAARLQEMGFDVDRKRVSLSHPFKAVGTYQVKIRLHTNLSTTVNVVVDREGGDEAPKPEPVKPAADQVQQEESSPQ